MPAPVGPPDHPDYRFTLANERTLLAWLRTALALVAGGVAVATYAPDLGIPGGSGAVALGLVLIGLAVVGGVVALPTASAVASAATAVLAGLALLAAALSPGLRRR